MSFIKKSMPELQRSVPAEQLTEASNYTTVVVLDGIRSRQNVGSIFRTADALEVNKIVLCGFTPTPPHRDIQKTALGATESVNWDYTEDISEYLQALIEYGYTIVGVEQVHGSTPLSIFKNEIGKKVALVFGNEVDGVSEAALGLCHECIEIDQHGSKHSLNVSVAAGIVLWKLSDKR